MGSNRHHNCAHYANGCAHIRLMIVHSMRIMMPIAVHIRLIIAHIMHIIMHSSWHEWAG